MEVEEGRRDPLYYAMFGEERRGPFTLEQLAEAGVRPDTYVWTKGMSQWAPAEDDADICRYFRQRLLELRHPARPALPPAEQTGEVQDPDNTAGYAYFRNFPEPEFDPAEHDPGEPPPSGIFTIAILVTILCFPLTGVIAIYYAVRAKKAWSEALRSSSRESYKLYNQSERDAIRQEMSASVRSCKMWTGISVFMGLVLYATLINAL